MDADIDVLTTRAFLEGIERRDGSLRDPTKDGVPVAADGRYWARVLASEPATNPRIQVFSQRRSK